MVPNDISAGAIPRSVKRHNTRNETPGGLRAGGARGRFAATLVNYPGAPYAFDLAGAVMN